jgi:short-subunit dehydrogenase
MLKAKIVIGTGVRDEQVLITGATIGIGLAAAESLASLGAKLAIVARNEARAQAALRRIKAADDPELTVDVLIANLSSQVSVRRLATALRRGDDRGEL